MDYFTANLAQRLNLDFEQVTPVVRQAKAQLLTEKTIYAMFEYAIGHTRSEKDVYAKVRSALTELRRDKGA